MTEQVEVQTSIVPVEATTMIHKALEFIQSIKSIVKINNDEENKNANNLIIKVKSGFNKLEEKRKEIVKPKNDFVTTVNAEFKKVTAPFKRFEGQLKSVTTDYDTEQDRKAQAEERRLQAEADAKRMALEEARRKEEEKAAAYRDQGRDDMAEKAEARAETKEQAAIETVAPVIVRKMATSGRSYKTVYEYKIDDKEKFIRFCLENPMLKHFVSIDEKAFAKRVQSDQGKVGYDGVTITSRKVASQRIG